MLVLPSLGQADEAVAETHVQSLDALGLNPRSQDLSSFVAAAGFAEAAAYYNLGDPPFVRGPWAVARFQVRPYFISRDCPLKSVLVPFRYFF